MNTGPNDVCDGTLKINATPVLKVTATRVCIWTGISRIPKGAFHLGGLYIWAKIIKIRENSSNFDDSENFVQLNGDPN